VLLSVTPDVRITEMMKRNGQDRRKIIHSYNPNTFLEDYDGTPPG
jgi:hypothetical protein